MRHLPDDARVSRTGSTLTGYRPGMQGDGPPRTKRRPLRVRPTAPMAPTPLNPNRSPSSCIRFPPNGFAVSLTLFSKYFSPFPHGTCSLSVSCRYLALDGVYHPLWAAFPNNPTLRRQQRLRPPRPHTGLSPSPTCPSRSTSAPPNAAQATSPGHNSPA